MSAPSTTDLVLDALAAAAGANPWLLAALSLAKVGGKALAKERQKRNAPEPPDPEGLAEEAETWGQWEISERLNPGGEEG